MLTILESVPGKEKVSHLIWGWAAFGAVTREP